VNFVWAIALLIVSYVITALTTPHPKNTDATPTKLTDFSFPVALEGTPQSVIFGDCWTPDWQVLWYGNLRTEAIRQSSGGGKK